MITNIPKILPLISITYNKNIVVLCVEKNLIILILSFLKNNSLLQYKLLTCISCIDFPTCLKRFAIVYELLSVQYNNRIRIKTFVDESLGVNSSCKVFSSANWWEREIWDLFGIFFINHPDLRRILTDYGFQGHPMRKDFPLTGFLESTYDDSKKRVVNTIVELSQNLKHFDYLSPWVRT